MLLMGYYIMMLSKVTSIQPICMDLQKLFSQQLILLELVLLQDLKIVQLKIVKNKLADLDPKRTEEIDQTIAAIEKSKTLIDQRYELQKELSQAREVEDFKTADTIYQKLKDVRSQQKDIEAETTKQIMQTEEKSPAEESLNL